VLKAVTDLKLRKSAQAYNLFVTTQLKTFISNLLLLLKAIQ